ncbi:hypothetical protein HALG_00015 [Halorubrum virus CGphi46]|uniref:Uncharacterized protein n=1 Tax=Halorubrum virus CGphi46 TaxID=754066 RepID=R9TLT0_9CAUD|nr:hypothetical protein HALG_00015 [Halorubrum virus CGphi46]AGN33803.1 hypothetical protein HALG_00015 [Halorubrum virus CGphi46]
MVRNTNSEQSESEVEQMRSKEEIETALRLYREEKDEPDRIANAERRRALLWVLGRDGEAEEIKYEDGVMPHAFR